MKLIRCDSTVIIFNWPAVNISLEDFIKKKGISIGDIDQSDVEALISFSDSLHIVTLQFTTAVSPLNRSWIIDQLRRLFI